MGWSAFADKAVLYHFVHAIVLFALALHPDVVSRAVSYFFFSGIILFSGSLYLLALTNARSLGAITPIGGLCFLPDGHGWSSHRRNDASSV